MKNSAFLRVFHQAIAVLAITLAVVIQPAVAKNSVKVSNTSSTTSANVAVVERFLEQVVNKGHFELIDQLWAKSLVWHGASLGEIRGIDAYKKVMKSAAGSSFSDMHLDIKDIIASGDKVVVHFTNSGTNTGSFLGQPATGKHATWEGIGIYRMDNGKIAEAWFVEDILGQQQQLGNWHSSASVQ